MSAAKVLMPVLNIGKLSDGRYKFSFATSAGTLFSEVSVAKIKSGQDLRSDAEKKDEALKMLKRIASQLDAVIADSGKSMSVENPGHMTIVSGAVTS